MFLFYLSNDRCVDNDKRTRRTFSGHFQEQEPERNIFRNNTIRLEII